MNAVIDTNIFLLTVNTDFPLFHELNRVNPDTTPVTTSSVQSELKRLCDNGNTDACTAHDLIRSKGLKIVSGSSTYADADIIDYAASHRDVVVITNDADLIDAVINEAEEVYRPRQQSHLIKA